MSKIIFLILVFVFVLGCSKKKENTETIQPKEEVAVEEFPDSINIKEYTESKPNIEIPKKPTIKEIQLALKNAGFYNGKIDGIIGPKTLSAVKEFQAKNNLKVDGKVGPKTWEKLKSYLNIKD